MLVGIGFMAGMVIGWAAAPVAIGLGLVTAILRGRAWWGLLAIVVATVVGAALAPDRPNARTPDGIDPVSQIHGTVESMPSSGNGTQRFELVVTVGSGRDLDLVGERVCVVGPALPVLARGDLVVLRAALTRLEDLPNGVGEAWAARGCVAQVRATSATLTERGTGFVARLDRFRYDLAGVLMRAGPGDTGVLLNGYVTGDDGALAADTRRAFVATGTTHLTAVSGSNFALVVGLVVAAGGAAGVRRTRGFAVVALGAIWTYALLVGLGPPSFRAALLATAVLVATLAGRRPDLLTLAFLTAALQLAIRPEDLYKPGFQLSFAASLALVLVLGARQPGSRSGMMATALLAVTAAQVATLPILLVSFGRISLASLPANLVVAPLAGAAFPIAFLAAIVGLVVPVLGGAIAFPAVLLAEVTIRLVDWAAKAPYATVDLGHPVPLLTWGSVVGSVLLVGLLSGEVRAIVADGAAVLFASTRLARQAALMLVGGAIAGGVAFALIR